MTRLEWDKVGEKLYETGVSQGVIYPQDANGTYPSGAAWNGLISVSENPTGAEPNALWADNIKYLNLISTEELEGSIEAYTYPDEFAACNGEVALVSGMKIGQQPRVPFGLCYRTILGNDTQLEQHGYKLHLIYGATVSPSEKSYETVNDSPDAIQMSWDYTTVPVNVTGAKPTASIEIDSTKFTSDDAAKLTALENVLYGSANTTARLPLPDEVKTILTTGQVPQS